MNNKLRITIGEIAELAGVSKTTISRVINNRPDVHPETRDRILKLMEENDFQPNIFARGIAAPRINHIGLIIPYTPEYIFSNQFYVDVLRGISNEIERRGFFLLICYVHATNYVEIYNQKRVDGFVLLSPGSLHHSIIQELQNFEIPFISTAKLINEPHMTYVDVDNIEGAIIAVDHLVALGHKDIAFVGKPALTSSYDRLLGYKKSLGNNQVPLKDEYIKVTESSSMQSGHDVMLELLNLENPPTAVFLANDVLALGAIKAIQKQGKNVPDDISVVGFDDIPLAQYTTPSLTTIKQPAVEKGGLATKLLIDFLTEGTVPETRILSTKLIKRNSTGPAKR